ncbi:MAG: type II toxin-antitoxin system RelE/ParE family toxin [Colwellia sp.]|nr:type II toxin-antitoxin system RelE/ParE family toxin [Colwellia sp.]
MVTYKLNQAAAIDIEHLFEYGIDNFGINKARNYIKGLTLRFDNIAKNPLHYPAVEHIKIGYRRSVYRQHSIYYRINDNIEIMRILRSEHLGIALSK